MPTIKTKKEMNLPELIEWGWKNEIKKRSFTSNDDKVTANFEDMGRFIADNFTSSDVTFTVEIEEPITEDTVFKHMIEVRGSDHTTWNNTSIADEKLPNSTQFYAYIDEGYKLIWRDGKLVE